MAKKVYIHYGASEHDPNIELNIGEVSVMNKPTGTATWASPVECEYPWEEWCRDEQFRDCDEDNSFKFTLSDDARLLVINAASVSLVSHHYRNKPSPVMGSYQSYLDWDAISKDYDAVELIMYGDDGIKSLGWEVSWDYSSWDVDSIAIWNPEVIIPVEKGVDHFENRTA